MVGDNDSQCRRGETSVLEVQAIDNHSAPQLKRKFTEARNQDYQLLLKEIGKASSTSSTSGRVSRIRQRFQEIVSVDFFGTPLREQVERALRAIEKPKTKEPHFEAGKTVRALNIEIEYGSLDRVRVWTE